MVCLVERSQQDAVLIEGLLRIWISPSEKLGCPLPILRAARAGEQDGLQPPVGRRASAEPPASLSYGLVPASLSLCWAEARTSVRRAGIVEPTLADLSAVALPGRVGDEELGGPFSTVT